MIKVFELDKAKLEEIYREEVRAFLIEKEKEKVYWTLKELCQQVQLSEPYVREHILYERDFPAWQEGDRWRILAAEARDWLTKRGMMKYRERKGIPSPLPRARAIAQ